MSSAVHVFDRLLELTALLREDLDSSLGALGLTPARAHLLWELHHRGPSTQQTLAGALQVSPRNVTGLVDAVEASGFAERRPHPRDRRATLVTLTAQGTAAMARMERDREEAAGQLVVGLDQEQLGQLAHHLDVVAGRLRALVEDAATGRER